MFSWMVKYQAGKVDRNQVCSKAGIKIAGFQYWWKRYRDSNPEVRVGSFVPVTLKATSGQAGEWKPEKHPGDGLSVRFSELIPIEYLSEVWSLA